MWKKITEEQPPQNKAIKTKISDEAGDRNEAYLKLSGNLWFLPDGSMYVYYTPTHWWDWVTEKSSQQAG